MVVGFIITSHYEIESSSPIIHLFGRLETGESFEVRTPYTPYFFIEKEDLKSIQANIKSKESNLKTMNNKKVVRIDTNIPKEVPELRSLFEKSGVACYEADIRFNRRFLIDKNILTLIEIKGEKQKGEFTDLLFIEPKINPIKKSPEIIKKCSPKMFSFDIETDSRAKQIYSIAYSTEKDDFVGVVRNEGITKVESKLNKTIVFDEEKDLLVWFFKVINEIDPDIITGWHVIDFDLKVIQTRAKHFDLGFNIGRSNRQSNLRIESSFFRDSSTHVDGRIVLDGIQLLKSSFIKLDNYKLNTAAKHFLNDSKLIEEDQRFEIIDKAYNNDPKYFLAYNIKDARLTYDIIIASGVYDLTIQRSLLTGLHMDNVKASIASFDSLYLRELRKKGVVAQCTNPGSRTEGLGGYVKASKPGIYDNILVLDFKSLYPSLMRTFNIDPYSYIGEKEELEESKSNLDLNNKDKFIIAPNNAVFKNTNGIMPDMLKTLWDERETARKENNELARYAIKILMNSMYGVLASNNSRYHIRNLSNAITYFGHHFIKLTAQKVEEDGYEVIYGDTDSIFVNINTKDFYKANEIGKEIEKSINIFMKQYITDNYHRESILEIEFEKLYVKFFMPTARDSEEGAKKRYAGLKVKDLNLITSDTKSANLIDPVLDFTGLEFVRKDWTEVSKDFQLKLLDLIFDDATSEDIEKYISGFVEDIKSGKKDNLLIYRKSLRKKVESYTKTTPPHVKAARLLDKIENSTIEYFITKEGPQPIQKLTAPLDYNHYINKQIKPIANSVLGLKGTSFEDVLSGSKQKGLGEFF